MADLTWIIVPAAIIGLIIISSHKKTQEYERAVVYRLGRYLGIRGPGHFWIIPFIDKAIMVDKKEYMQLQLGAQAELELENSFNLGF